MRHTNIKKITASFHLIRSYIFSDIGILIILCLITIIPRVIFLDQIPNGLHGDEAWTGLDARKLLHDGSIPAYVDSALGQPTGPLYVTALFFRFFGDSIFTLRLSMAVFGIITIPLFYLLLRHFFNKKVSFLSSFAFSTSLMHLHFSRIGFMLIAAPAAEIFTFITLFKGREKKNYWLIAMAGIISGLGLYTYNTFIIFPALILPLFLYDLLFSKEKKFTIISALLFYSFTFIAGFALIKIIITTPDFYFSHFKIFSITSTQNFQLAHTLPAQIGVVLQNGVMKLNGYFFGNQIDFADGFGKYYTFGIFSLIISGIGIISSIRSRKPLPIFLILFSVIVLLSSFITIQGVYRRLILFLVPFYFFFAVTLHKVEILKNKRIKSILFLLLIMGIFLQSIFNFYTYFYRFAHDADMKFVFTEELTKAALITRKIRTNEIVSLYSNRWPCDYETMRYILGTYFCTSNQLYFNNQISIKPDKHTIYIFLANYIDLYNQLSLTPGKTYYITDNDTQQIIGIVFQSK